MVSDPYASLLASWLNHRGHCQCGWEGKRRWLRGSAVLDVLDHCSETGHVPVSLPFQSRQHSSAAGRTSVRSTCRNCQCRGGDSLPSPRDCAEPRRDPIAGDWPPVTPASSRTQVANRSQGTRPRGVLPPRLATAVAEIGSQTAAVRRRPGLPIPATMEHGRYRRN